MKRGSTPLILVALLALGGLGPALAQNATGALYVTVFEEGGAALPGASVELEGLGHRRTQITDSRGQFRFLNLEPGGWSVKVTLDGFSSLEYTDIDIRAGRSTTLEMELSAAVEDRITVVAETPLLDERKLSIGTILTDLELKTIPTAGDPWALVKQAPGVMVDRIDIGGSRSQQSLFTAPASNHSDNEWQMDGVEITDQAGSGGQPIGYFDMDQFAQVEITTSGNEISKAKPGVSVNLVTRRGSNELQGSARFLIADDGLQSSPNIDSGEIPPGQTEIRATEIHRIENMGFEAGGPAIRDHLWLWGSYGENSSVENVSGVLRQETDVESVAFKVNAQLSPANSAAASWTTTDKVVPNRGAPGAQQGPETRLFQRGPSDVLKIEDSHVFGSNLFLTGSYSNVAAGFSQTPIACLEAGGCDNAEELLLDDDGVVVGSFYTRDAQRPSEQFLLEGSYFFGSGETSHELKVGVRRRDFEVINSRELPGGRDIGQYAGSNFGLPDGIGYFFVERFPGAPTLMEYDSVWVQDTVSSGAWTFNAGLRYDVQDGNNEPFQVEAHSIFPELLAAIDFPGDSAVGWESVSPRLGVTYALGDEGKTLLRASYSRFAGALSSGIISRLSPVDYAYLEFFFDDLDLDDRWAGPEETARLIGFGGFDPADPSAISNPNRNDPDLDPELTDEIVLGVERALRSDLVAGIAVTWRNRSDIMENRQIVRDVTTGEERFIRREDYLFFDTREIEQPNGQPFEVDYYFLGDHVQDLPGSLKINGDREVEYLGASLTATKRLSQGWMLTAFLNLGESEWRIPASFVDNPNHTGGDLDGEVFGQTGGRTVNGPSILSSGWSFNINGLYQVAPEKRWGFDVSGSIYGRQGYPIPYEFSTFYRGRGTANALAVETLDSFRYEDVLTTDLRIAKEFDLGNKVNLTVTADVFNVFNEGYILERDPRLNRSNGNFVLETLAPRVLRLGARISRR